MTDPLAQFRKKPITSAGPASPTASSDGYVAFTAKDKVERLKIRRSAAPTRSPGYSWLLDVTYDPHGHNFVLVYTFMMVLVRGKNLQAVISALEAGTADSIQEFDSDRWEKPKEATTPLIESIEVVVQENGPTIADSENGSVVH